jgi:hypothetical protein
MKNLLVTTKNQLTTCTNQSITDQFVQRYQKYTQNALENILCMGEAVFEIYHKVKSNELDNSDLEYFCQSVHLNPKSSTFRKYKAIGENAQKFRDHLNVMPNSFSVLYELATLDGDIFEVLISDNQIHNKLTLADIKRLTSTSPNSAKVKNVNQLTFEVKFDPNSMPKHDLEKFVVVIRYLYQSSIAKQLEFIVPEKQLGKFGLLSAYDLSKKCWVPVENKPISKKVPDEKLLSLEGH